MPATPDPTRVCALDGCDNTFAPARKNQRFCIPEHGKRASNQRQRMSDPIPRAQLTDEERADKKLEHRLLEARSSRDAAIRQLRVAERRIDELHDDLETARWVAQLVDDTGKVAAPKWMRSVPAPKERHAMLVAALSDVHAGEIVSRREMDGYNAYDMTVCEQRLRRYFERVILMSRQYLTGVVYDGVVVACMGDMVSGDELHDELTRTNELRTPEVIPVLVSWLAAGFEMLLEEFGAVHVVHAPGNHGRRTGKPVSKQRTQDNDDTLVMRLVADRMRDVPGITFDIPPTFDVDFTVYGTRFTASHGDDLMGRGGGTGILGVAPAMIRKVHQKRDQRQREGKPFDLALAGHVHQLQWWTAFGLVTNGSVKGYDEYARSLHLRPEPPQQALLVVTPEHGPTVQAPVLVSKRSEEGW